MTEKKRDTSKKRDSILDAAMEAFIELGYEKTSMDYVAEVAQASKRTVYNHFPSKETLFTAVCDRSIASMYEQKKITYDPNKSIEEQLGEFADVKIKPGQDPKMLGLMRVYISTFITYPELAKKLLNEVEGQEDSLEAWLIEANKDGRLHIDDVNMAAEVFWSLFGGGFFWPAIVSGPVEEKRAVRIKKEFIDTFLAKYR